MHGRAPVAPLRLHYLDPDLPRDPSSGDPDLPLPLFFAPTGDPERDLDLSRDFERDAADLLRDRERDLPSLDLERDLDRDRDLEPDFDLEPDLSRERERSFLPFDLLRDLDLDREGDRERPSSVILEKQKAR